MTYHVHTPALAAAPLPPQTDPAASPPAVVAPASPPPADPDDPSGPDQADDASEQFPFTPVPVAARHDGWTVPRQRRFIVALAAGGCVREAARNVGMSVESAYRLRRRPHAQAFRLAWDAALDFAMGRIADELTSRAINGVEIPHYWRGEVVGTHRRYDNRLSQWLLSTRSPARFTRRGYQPAGSTDEPAQRVDMLLYALEHDETVHAPWFLGRTGTAADRLVADLDRMDAELEADAPEDHAVGGDAA